MSNSDTSGSGNTLKVTDAYLQGVAQHQIDNFLTAIETDPQVTTIQNYANFTPGGTEQGDGPGLYNALMPGGGPLTEASTLQNRFQELCVALQSELETLQTQMMNMSVDLQEAQTTLQNAADDSLTAAQMLQVLNNVYQDVGNINTSLPTTNTNINTSANVNTNTNTNTNVNVNM